METKTSAFIAYGAAHRLLNMALVLAPMVMLLVITHWAVCSSWHLIREPFFDAGVPKDEQTATQAIRSFILRRAALSWEFLVVPCMTLLGLSVILATSPRFTWAKVLLLVFHCLTLGLLVAVSMVAEIAPPGPFVTLP